MSDEESESTLMFKNMVARLDKVRVKGIKRTKDDIITNALSGVFKCKNLNELIQNAVVARLNLEKLYCFKKIRIIIDTSSGPRSTPNYGYEVTFDLTEYSRLTGKCGMSLANNSDGSLHVNFQSPNLVGRGECLELQGRYGINEMKTFDVNFAKPLFRYNGLLTTSAFKNFSENLAAGYKLKEHGIAADLSFLYADNIKHNMRWEGIIRYVNVTGKYVPFSIREQSGYTLKSAFRNTLSIDTRDSPILPTEGNLFQLKSEFAGLGGNIGFMKNEIMSQFNVPLLVGTSFQVSFAAGVNLANRSKTTSIVDNFFIGGPLTLRGFNPNSVGPKVDGYALGSSMYFINAVHLYTPLPHRPKKGSLGDSFRIHLFCNMGNNTAIGNNPNECLEKLTQNFKLSYGLGLLYRFRNMARFELNYCIPVFYSSDDKLVDGVQFGFGFDFI